MMSLQFVVAAFCVFIPVFHEAIGNDCDSITVATPLSSHYLGDEEYIDLLNNGDQMECRLRHKEVFHLGDHVSFYSTQNQNGKAKWWYSKPGSSPNMISYFDDIGLTQKQKDIVIVDSDATDQEDPTYLIIQTCGSDKPNWLSMRLNPVNSSCERVRAIDNNNVYNKYGTDFGGENAMKSAMCNCVKQYLDLSQCADACPESGEPLPSLM